jgi:hypothetical protein
MLQNHPVSLDKPRPQDFVPRDKVVKCTREGMVVNHPSEPQHSQQIEYGRSRVDFIRQPKCALLCRG